MSKAKLRSPDQYLDFRVGAHPPSLLRDREKEVEREESSPGIEMCAKERGEERAPPCAFTLGWPLPSPAFSRWNVGESEFPSGVDLECLLQQHTDAKIGVDFGKGVWG